MTLVSSMNKYYIVKDTLTNSDLVRFHTLCDFHPRFSLLILLLSTLLLSTLLLSTLFLSTLLLSTPLVSTQILSKRYNLVCLIGRRATSERKLSKIFSLNQKSSSAQTEPLSTALPVDHRQSRRRRPKRRRRRRQRRRRLHCHCTVHIVYMAIGYKAKSVIRPILGWYRFPYSKIYWI